MTTTLHPPRADGHTCPAHRIDGDCTHPTGAGSDLCATGCGYRPECCQCDQPDAVDNAWNLINLIYLATAPDLAAELAADPNWRTDPDNRAWADAIDLAKRTLAAADPADDNHWGLELSDVVPHFEDLL